MGISCKFTILFINNQSNTETKRTFLQDYVAILNTNCILIEPPLSSNNLNTYIIVFCISLSYDYRGNLVHSFLQHYFSSLLQVCGHTFIHSSQCHDLWWQTVWRAVDPNADELNVETKLDYNKIAKNRILIKHENHLIKKLIAIT